MSLFQILNVAGSAISAQSQRLNVVASNLANVDTVAGPDGSTYKARQVAFQTEMMGSQGNAGVRVSNVSEDQSAGRRVHDPHHPSADAEGYVTCTPAPCSLRWQKCGPRPAARSHSTSSARPCCGI